MGVVGGLSGLWLCATVARARLIRRFGRPTRRVRNSAEVPLNAVDVQIVTDSGAILRGWLRRPVPAHPADSPAPVALVIHGWGSSAGDMIPLSDPLLAAGLNVLLIDARGHGRSSDVRVVTMPTFAEDLRSAVRWLRDQPEFAPESIVLVGHSVGAGAALFVAADDHAIAGVISLSSMAAPREFMAARLRARFPGLLVRIALKYVERIIGHRYDEFAPLHDRPLYGADPPRPRPARRDRALPRCRTAPCAVPRTNYVAAASQREPHRYRSDKGGEADVAQIPPRCGSNTWAGRLRPGADVCAECRHMNNLSHGPGATTCQVREGRLRVKLAPRPGPGEAATMSPPWARAMPRAMVSPIPEPADRRDREGTR